MRHFIQYHNSDLMGPYEGSPKAFGIVTSKSAVQPGDTVWLIVGKGMPRRYFLCEAFVVEAINPRRSGRFSYHVSASVGKGFIPPVEVGKLAWFPELLRLTGNFRYGLQPIKSQEIIGALQSVTEA